jgi:hypothetical protein
VWLAWIVPGRLVKRVATRLWPERIRRGMWMDIVCIPHQLLLWWVLVVRPGTHGGRIACLLWLRRTLMRRISARRNCWVPLGIFVWGCHAVAGAAGCDTTGVARFHWHLASIGAVSDRLNVR